MTTTMMETEAMTLRAVILSAINPALLLLPRAMDSAEARVMLLAIGIQESRFSYRRQMGGGPARGFWQFEQGGGVRGIVRHSASRYWAESLCRARGVEFKAPAIYAKLETDDVLAAGCARLLLFTDPKRLPTIGDEAGAWGLYIRTWRPGHERPETWSKFYAASCAAVAPAEVPM